MSFMQPAYQPDQSAIREWEALMRQLGQMAEACVDFTARPERIWQVNQLDALIESTALGERVGDSSYTRERAKAARLFVQQFMSWSQTPILIETLPNGDEIRLSPIQIISMRISN